jgi:xanthine dehydrogenase accessory factor
MRGHDLGRVIVQGTALPNTGIPGVIGGVGKERVLHAPCNGILYNKKAIGDEVAQGEIIAEIDGLPITATIDGILRGLIRNGFPVTTGFKIADIDPRESEKANCFTISDKARCIGGSALEAVLQLKHSKQL